MIRSILNNKKLGFALSGLALIAIPAAFASRSSFYANTSSDFPFSYKIQKDLALKDRDGKPITLTSDGLLLQAKETSSGLSADDRKDRSIQYLDISVDGSKSFLRIRTPGSTLLGNYRDIRFNLPTKVDIDASGRPMGIENYAASASDTGQGIGLKILLSNPGAWSHYEFDSTRACTITHTRRVCAYGAVEKKATRKVASDPGDHHPDPVRHDDDHHDDHRDDDHHVPVVVVDPCHVETIDIPGIQNVHTSGDRKSDGYSITLDNNAAEFDFTIDYDNSSEAVSPCMPR